MHDSVYTEQLWTGFSEVKFFLLLWDTAGLRNFQEDRDGEHRIIYMCMYSHTHSEVCLCPNSFILTLFIFVLIVFLYTLVWHSCHSKIPEAGWFEQQKQIFLKFSRLEVYAHSVGRVNFSLSYGWSGFMVSLWSKFPLLWTSPIGFMVQPLTSFNPNDFWKGPFPYSEVLGVRISVSLTYKSSWVWVYTGSSKSKPKDRL